MSIKDFFKRRLIRLHPLVIMGALLGAITFCIQGSVQWDGTKVPLAMVLLAMLLSMILIPAFPGTGVEVRGHNEMFPLNGPSWSLFFEYIGNILYAFFIRKLSTKWLGVLVALAAIGLSGYAIFDFSGYGHLGVGWSLSDNNFIGGFLRLLFAFSMGLFISRIFKPIKIKGAFWICSAIIIILLSIPYVGGENAKWMNGIYDSFCTILIFPIIVFFGASGTTTTKISKKICKLLGDISYPLYIVHYPFMYLFYAWLWKNNYKFEQVWPVTLLLFFGNILIAYIILKVYDEPVRKWLTSKLHKGEKNNFFSVKKV
jgi:Predicted acyltransferases